MKEIFADLHIHIGSTLTGRPVKITASRALTVPVVLETAVNVKGLHMVGIVDAATTGVIKDLESLDLFELPNGGLTYQDKLTVIPGSEFELYTDKGSAHFLGYFPDLKSTREFTNWLKRYVSNSSLSTQVVHGVSGDEAARVVKGLGGLFVPAHAFTPFKGVYGRVLESLSEMFSERVDGLELGLSASKDLALLIPETGTYPFLTNSDAHSKEKIAREYNRLRVKNPDFKGLKEALAFIDGQGIIANYGLDPRLGKYHRSYCESCQYTGEGERPIFACPQCGSDRLVMGVYDRLLYLHERSTLVRQTIDVPYFNVVPLEMVPNIGPKTREQILNLTGTELALWHDTEESILIDLVGRKKAGILTRIRKGEYKLIPGGGGHYGKIDIS